MIIRIVKMQFKPDQIDDFLEIFTKSHPKIRKYEGCQQLKLVQDVRDSSVFFTISHWETEEALENYRNSELFRSTWAKTRQLFVVKAQAWSTKIHTRV